MTALTVAARVLAWLAVGMLAAVLILEYPVPTLLVMFAGALALPVLILVVSRLAGDA